MKPYEAIIIFRSSVATEKIDASVSKFEKKIKDVGGTDVIVTRWGMKKFAYPVKKAKNDTEGYYVFINFSGEGPVPNELRSLLNVTEDVIRYSVINSRPPEKEVKEEKVEIEPSMILNQPGTYGIENLTGEQKETSA